MRAAKPSMFALALLLVSMFSPVTGADVTFEQATAAYDAGDYREAGALWRQLAEAGDPAAMFSLGALFLEGPGDVGIDYAESTRWFMAGAKLDHPAELHVQKGAKARPYTCRQKQNQKALSLYMGIATAVNSLVM